MLARIQQRLRRVHLLFSLKQFIAGDIRFGYDLVD
jgi:hypothetical protein